jgi:hypothetical protein
VTDGKTTPAFDVCLQTPVPFQDITKAKRRSHRAPNGARNGFVRLNTE